MKRTNLFATAITVSAVVTSIVLALTGCGQGGIGDTTSNHSDLRGVTFHRPDRVDGYNNVDGQPNIVRLCIGGVAFATSSREYASILRVPEWDASYCGSTPK